MKALHLALGILMLSAISITSCLKKEYDAPPDLTSFDPMLKVTHNIAQLKALNGAYNPSNGGDTTFIGQDIVISGIVTANDRSGNFYKQLVIQDDTSAIMLVIDANNLYNDYPVGRKVYVKCKGLWLGYDGGLPVLGYSPNEQNGLNLIPQQRMNDFIVRANIGNTVKADTVDLATIKAAQARYYNRLIHIREAEFADTNQAYSQPNSTTNRDIKDCSGNTLVVRTSNYSNFANVPVAKGRGGITGIYTVFISSSRATPQLLIRDTGDVQFTKPRCGVVTGNILLAQTFENLPRNTTNITGWVNYAQTGNELYAVDSFGGTKFAKVSAFGSTQATVKSWLISPLVNLSGTINPKLIFKTLAGYDNGATLKVFISDDYAGIGDPTTATWMPLSAVISKGPASGYASTWTFSGNINLNTFSGAVYISFLYEGSDPASGTKKTTTFELDDVIVVAD
ncbi:MAG TPA: DUF5689 domain-containing protein [Flavipsychrobacter sp.]|nr:DUF5689 domain-containing protein [Flavipsychrobacter sp.]